MNHKTDKPENDPAFAVERLVTLAQHAASDEARKSLLNTALKILDRPRRTIAADKRASLHASIRAAEALPIARRAA